MNLYIKTLVIVLISVFSSCTDVIEVDLPAAPPRLVIEASIDWEKGTDGGEQLIKLTTTTPFFSSQGNNAVTNATVKITNNNDNTEFVFNNANDGTYTIANFVPVINQSYTLEVVYNGETYIAQETLTPVVEVAEVYQSVSGGFDDQALEVNIDFDDPSGIDNFYFFRFQEPGDLLPELLDITDAFTDGNRMTVFYEKIDDEDNNQQEFEVGDVAHIEFYGVSEQYSNYIGLLIQQYNSVGDPFGTEPAALRGNCTNVTHPDNYAFGYFRLSERVTINYTFQ